MDGQTPEGAQMILVFSSVVAIQGHDIGIILDVARKTTPSHSEGCSVDVDHHVGHEVDLPVRVGPAETGIIGDVDFPELLFQPMEIFEGRDGEVLLQEGGVAIRDVVPVRSSGHVAHDEPQGQVDLEGALLLEDDVP